MKKKLQILGCIMLVFCLTACGSKKNETETKVEEPKEEVKAPAPAKNTEELVSSMKKVKTKKITTNTIEFAETIKVEEGDMIAVWVYSEPKFLGYFKVVLNDGKKVIEGLEDALKKQSIESGNHNIALVTEEGTNIGYVDIYIHDDGNMVAKEEAKIVKEETKKEVVKYATKKESDATLTSGKTEVIQKGEDGEKTITYSVTYDADGKELSRKKIKEEITKEAKDEIIKVGSSDIEVNKSMLDGTGGIVCTEDQLIKEDGYIYCDSDLTTSFLAVVVDKKSFYIYNINDTKLSKAIKATKSGEYPYTANYNGKKYYFDTRMGGGEPVKATPETCKEYSLPC